MKLISMLRQDIKDCCIGVIFVLSELILLGSHMHTRTVILSRTSDHFMVDSLYAVDQVCCSGSLSTLWILTTVTIGALVSIPLIAFGKLNQYSRS